jgi:hypothetical protein
MYDFRIWFTGPVTGTCRMIQTAGIIYDMKQAFNRKYQKYTDNLLYSACHIFVNKL